MSDDLFSHNPFGLPDVPEEAVPLSNAPPSLL